MKHFETLSEAMNALRARGYSNDFNLKEDSIECSTLQVNLKPTEFHVDEVHRFEGATNPDDSSVLYAISSPEGIKGIIVDAYGAYAESLSDQMISKLIIDKQTEH